MANSKFKTVIYVDTTADFTGPLVICGVKYIGASGGTLVITDKATSARIYEESGTGNQQLEDLDVFIKQDETITVTVASSAKCYLYLE